MSVSYFVNLFFARQNVLVILFYKSSLLNNHNVLHLYLVSENNADLRIHVYAIPTPCNVCSVRKKKHYD